MKAGFKISINYRFSQNNVFIKNEMYIQINLNQPFFKTVVKKLLFKPLTLNTLFPREEL
jgi:hypothetical protein